MLFCSGMEGSERESATSTPCFLVNHPAIRTPIRREGRHPCRQQAQAASSPLRLARLLCRWRPEYPSRTLERIGGVSEDEIRRTVGDPDPGLHVGDASGGRSEDGGRGDLQARYFDESRPHLHTSCVIANMIQGTNDKWRATAQPRVACATHTSQR